jgi:hypothetical protein
MKRKTSEEFLEQFRKTKEEWTEEKNKFYSLNPLDEEGYPTEITIKYIRRWHFHDAKSMFEYIKKFWAFANDGYWREEIVTEDEFNGLEYDEPRLRYIISTAGWSGNEAIIRAMQENHMIWHLCWVESRRGGHYIFELTERE